MGKLRHRAIDNEERGSVPYSIWRDDANTHEIDDLPGLDIVRPATVVIAATDSSADSKAMADYKCDGTNDEDDIQAAINALPAIGGRVLFAEGTYTCAATVNILKDYVTLEGQGDSTVWKMTAASKMCLVTGATKTTVAGFQLRNMKLQHTANGDFVYFGTDTAYSVTDARLKGLTFLGNQWSSQHCYDGSAATTDCLFEDWVVDDVGVIFGLAHDKRTTIRNIKFYNIFDSVADMASDHEDLLVENVVGDCNLKGAGLLIRDEGRGKITIRSCKIKKPTTAGFQVFWESPVTQAITDVNLIDCHVEQAGQESFDVEGDADGTYITKRVTLIGCSATKGDQSGLRIDRNAQDVLVLGFRARNNGQDGTLAALYRSGILVRTNQTNIRLIDCESTDDQGTPTQQWGIYYDSTGSGCVMGNYVNGNVTGQISLKSGYTAVVRDNIGFLTENSGTATINSGATSVVITHGLAVTPTLDDIGVSFGENPTNDPGNWWISAIGATQFTINVRSDPGASNLDLAWHVKVLP